MTKMLAAALVAFVPMVPSMVQAEDLEFLLVNDSSADVTGFFVSPKSSGNWENNLLHNGYLAPGYEIGVLIGDGLSTCIYDIRGEFSDGTTVEDFGLDLCDLGEYFFTD